MTTFTCNTKMLNAKRSRRSILQLRQIREGRNLQDLQNLVEVPPAIQDPPSKQTMAAESPGTATTTDAGTASATNDFGYMRTHRSSRTPRADNTRPSLGDLREASVLPQLGKLTVLAPPPQIHALQKALVHCKRIHAQNRSPRATNPLQRWQDYWDRAGWAEGAHPTKEGLAKHPRASYDLYPHPSGIPHPPHPPNDRHGTCKAPPSPSNTLHSSLYQTSSPLLETSAASQLKMSSPDGVRRKSWDPETTATALLKGCETLGISSSRLQFRTCRSSRK